MLFELMAMAAQSLAPAPSVAGNITAQDPKSVVAAVQNAGFKASLTKDETGDPMIESAANGSNFIIFFMNCTKNVDCRTLQFFAGFTNYKGGLAQMNEWNAKNRFGRGYISEKGAARIEMDLDLDDGGQSPKLFEDNLEYWVLIMGKFENFVADTDPKKK